MAIIKVGDKFTNNQGCEAVVIIYRGAYNIRVKFLDKHGAVGTFNSSNLRRGVFKNPFYPSAFGKGYLGSGRHETSFDGKKSATYVKWISMLARCYAPKTNGANSSYENCSVCDEWLNYQNFAEWYEGNKPNAFCVELDKDLLNRGNKIYSPENCQLIPREINLLISIDYKKSSGLPTGVKRVQKKYAARARSGDGDSVWLGTFNTPEEAHAAYVTAKEAYVKEVAQKWKGKIDPRVYDALMRWRVNPE